MPVLPPNPFASAYEKGNPYPYSTSTAVTLLMDNGWTVNPGGISVCADAAKCGVPKGTKLQFTMQYVNNGPIHQQQANAEVATWAKAGIKVTLTTGTFDTVIGNAILQQWRHLHPGAGELGRQGWLRRTTTRPVSCISRPGPARTSKRQRREERPR